MLMYFRELSLEEGFKVLAEPKKSRLVNGRSILPPSGHALYKEMYAARAPMICWSCGIEANCFVLNKGRNDLIRPPVLDLFSHTTDGRYVLITRDHIIPKSYGGSNENGNLRVGCTNCNGARGNDLEPEDLEFMIAHPELILPEKAELAAEVIAKALAGTLKVELTSEELAEREARRAAKRRERNRKLRAKRRAKRKANEHRPSL